MTEEPGRGGVITEPWVFWWPASRLTCRWRPFTLGGDEWGRRRLGVRLPGGMLFLPLWRFRGWRGPCAECGEWDPPEFWRDPLCGACAKGVS